MSRFPNPWGQINFHGSIVQNTLLTEANGSQLPMKKKLKSKRTFDFILDYVRNVHPGVSRVDVLCFAYGEQLRIPVVTDDEEMRQAAGDYGINTLKTLDLLKLMLDSGHIDMAKVREIAAYRVYIKDTPKAFKADYKRLFGEEPPHRTGCKAEPVIWL